MRITNQLRRRAVTWATAGLAVAGVASALSLTAASAAPVTSARHSGAFTFALVPSPGIHSCLPHAGGRVTIIPGSQNDAMEVSVFGMPKNADFDLFVIQQPNKPFGVSWYQTDINADRHGVGHATVRGIFDAETFSVSTGGTTTFGATHQYHLGLWFNDPNLPYNLGCEPNGPGTQPVVTPFNGEQHAGIQALNTAQFPVGAGPLSHVHR
ncbi:MAG: hypothetical protein ACRDOC_03350 [Streptosporangiaceae bacterium]